MPSDLVELLDAMDRTVAASKGIVSEETSARSALRAAELRHRRGYQGQTFVMAIAGGTGTGKSSLLNAIAREEVASVSRLRPHTDRPLAWLPEQRGPALDELLTRLGIMDFVGHARIPGLALIDLPDVDSIREHHRRIVEDLIPRVDGVIWVFDPAKYRDPSIHATFLGPLSDYREQFLFVLNKMDTVDLPDREVLAGALRERLEAGGYPDPAVYLTAAAPATGDIEGVDELTGALVTLASEKSTALTKWLIDISGELRTLAIEAGVWNGASVDLRERWTRDRDAAAIGILPGRGPGSRSDAVCRLEDLVAMVAVEAGPRSGSAVRALFPEGSIEDVLDDAARSAADAAASAKRKRRAEDAAVVAAREVLDDRIGQPLRAALDARARFGATLVEAAVRAAEARAAVGI